MSEAAAGASQRQLLLLLAMLGLPLAGRAGAEPAVTAPQSALQSCAGIAADAERLACYDRLARPAEPRASATVAPPTVTAAAPAAAASAAAATAPSPPVTGAASAAGSAAPPKESFGLYAAEHPKPPATAPSLEARVVALGRSPSGRMTVSLEGGALWELDAVDPLLKVGDTVTITRAALGSYLLKTPSRRLHRVRRLH